MTKPFSGVCYHVYCLGIVHVGDVAGFDSASFMPTVYMTIPSRYHAFDQVIKQIQLLKVIKVGCLIIFSVVATLFIPCSNLLS